uniref:Uncharacterized protein n=2 Tax=Micrurus TaxID=8634 RepID=A0A2D4F607_MICCO
MVTYKDLLNEEGELKIKRELQNQGVELAWLLYPQIQSRYEKDAKAHGFYKEPTTFDQILYTIDEELKKIYTFLLNLKMEGEQAKDIMRVCKTPIVGQSTN